MDIHLAMQRRGLLEPVAEKQCELTELAREWIMEIGRDHPLRRRERIARLCLDWTERQHHLGGPLGAVLLSCFCDRKWMVRMRGRAVRLTVNGRIELGRRLGLAL